MTTVIKLGGRIQTDPALITALVARWSDDPGSVCVVHGGGLATGTVTSVEQTHLKVNGRPLWRIRYQFTDRQGRKVDGKSEAMPWEEVERLGEGASGKVRFDPAKPTSNLWMG